MRVDLCLAACLHFAYGVQVHPLYPGAIQPSWQASVPVPINVTYDVPTNGQYEEETLSLLGNEDPSATGFADLRLENTSFALSPERLIVQAVMPEQFNIRLHEPSENVQQSLDGVEAVEKLWKEDHEDSRKLYIASKQQLFDSIGMNIKYVNASARPCMFRRIVRQSFAPLATLRNPLT